MYVATFAVLTLIFSGNTGWAAKVVGTFDNENKVGARIETEMPELAIQPHNLDSKEQQRKTWTRRIGENMRMQEAREQSLWKKKMLRRLG